MHDDPRLKVVAPSTAADVKGLLAAAIRDPDPVISLKQKSLYAMKGEVPDGEILDKLGVAKILRGGADARSSRSRRWCRARWRRPKDSRPRRHQREVVDVRSLVPLDTQTILGTVARLTPVYGRRESALLRLGRRVRLDHRGRSFLGSRWAPVRITTPHMPLPATDILEDRAMPSVERIAERVQRSLNA